MKGRPCDSVRARAVGVDQPVARGVPGAHRQSHRGEAEALGAGVAVHPGSEVLHACHVEPGEYLAEDLVVVQVRHADAGGAELVAVELSGEGVAR